MLRVTMPEARTAADRIRERSAQLRKGLPGGARETKSVRSDVDQAGEPPPQTSKPPPLLLRLRCGCCEPRHRQQHPPPFKLKTTPANRPPRVRSAPSPPPPPPPPPPLFLVVVVVPSSSPPPWSAEELQADVETLRGDLDRRGVSYERREMDYMNRIKTLGAEIERVREGRGQEVSAEIEGGGRKRGREERGRRPCRCGHEDPTPTTT